MLRGLPYILIAFMLLTGGMWAGAAGQADELDKTYTPADWEPGGKLHEESEPPPEILVDVGLVRSNDSEPDLWLRQFISAILNLSFGGAYAVAQFVEQHRWVPWVFISQALTAGMVIGTVYAVVKNFKPGLLADLMD